MLVIILWALSLWVFVCVCEFFIVAVIQLIIYCWFQLESEWANELAGRLVGSVDSCALVYTDFGQN